MRTKTASAVQSRVPFDLMSLAPTNDLMLGGWLGCIHWAIGDADILAAFQTATGIKWTPGRTPLDRMIDEACGAQDHFMEQFVRWVNREIWGKIDGRACNGDERVGEPEAKR